MQTQWTHTHCSLATFDFRGGWASHLNLFHPSPGLLIVFPQLVDLVEKTVGVASATWKVQFRNFSTFVASWKKKLGKFTWQIHLFCSKLLANRIDKFRRKSTDSAALHGRMLRVLDGSTTLRKLRKSGVRGKWFMPKFTRLVDRTTCGVHGYMGIWGSVDMEGLFGAISASAGVICFSHGERPTEGRLTRGRGPSLGNRSYKC